MSGIPFTDTENPTFRDYRGPHTPGLYRDGNVVVKVYRNHDDMRRRLLATTRLAEAGDDRTVFEGGFTVCVLLPKPVQNSTTPNVRDDGWQQASGTGVDNDNADNPDQPTQPLNRQKVPAAQMPFLPLPTLQSPSVAPRTRLQAVKSLSCWYRKAILTGLSCGYGPPAHGDFHLNNVLIDQSARKLILIDASPDATEASTKLVWRDLHLFIISLFLTSRYRVFDALTGGWLLLCKSGEVMPYSMRDVILSFISITRYLLQESVKKRRVGMTFHLFMSVFAAGIIGSAYILSSRVKGVRG